MEKTPVKKKVEERYDITSPERLLDIYSPSSPALSVNARSANNLVTQFNKLVSEWKQLSVKSLVIIKTISQTQLTCIEKNEFYPLELESLFTSVQNIASGFQDIVIAMNVLRKQFEALSKLSLPSEPLVSTWTAIYLMTFIHKAIQAYESELEAKKCVLENIAHAKKQSQLAMFGAVWEYEVYLRDISQEFTSLCKEMDIPISTNKVIS